MSTSNIETNRKFDANEVHPFMTQMVKADLQTMLTAVQNRLTALGATTALTAAKASGKTVTDATNFINACTNIDMLKQMQTTLLSSIAVAP